MRISQLGPPDGETDTVLVGELMDRSAFTGVINTLVNLQMTILSVESDSEVHRGPKTSDPGIITTAPDFTGGG